MNRPLPLLMKHQRDWVADNSPMKLAEKARRTGITFAEALDATLIAAAARGAGGANVFYMGDTRDKGREFLDVARGFAAGLERSGMVAGAKLSYGPKSSGKLEFASGFRIEALSSRPENIRGLQGVVVIDEAAFHADVHRLLDAVTALLIWGGRVRVISTHNGTDSPFNALVEGARAERIPMSLHRITFADAVQNGLYERTCAAKGERYSKLGERQFVEEIIAAYGTRHDARAEELDVVPRQSRGRYFADALLKRASHDAGTVLRLTPPDGFEHWGEVRQGQWADQVIEQELVPAAQILNGCDAHYAGEDFGRAQDRTVVLVGAARDGAFQLRLMVEFAALPYEVQKKLLFALVEEIPKLKSMVMDATGNGAWIAEVTKAKFGSIIHPQNLSAGFYDRAFPAYRAALEKGEMQLVADEDLLSDHRAVRLTPDGPRLARGARTLGRDGRPRHGDGAVASLLAHHAFAEGARRPTYNFQSAGKRRFA